MRFTSNKLENLTTRKMKKEKVILTSVAALMSVTSVAGIAADANAEVLKNKDLAELIHSEAASKKAITFEEAERNLSNAKGKYNTAKSDMEQAKKEAEEAKAAFDDALKNESILHTGLSQKEESTKVAFRQTALKSAEDVLTAQDSLEQAKKDKESAEENATSKTDAYNKALKEWEKANEAYESLKEKYGNLSYETVEDARISYETAVENKSAVETELNDLKNELPTVQADLATAEQVWEDAKTDLEAVTSKKEEAEAAVSSAESAYKDAKAELDSLDNTVDTSSPEYQEKYNQMVTAKAEWDRLSALKDDAEADYQGLKAAADKAEEEYLKIETQMMEVSDALDEAEGRLFECVEAEAAAKEQYDKEKAAYDSALEDVKPKLDALNQAEENAREAKEALTKAQTAKEEADQEVADVKKAVEDAEKALSDASKKLEEQGSLGFFEYVGNETAVNQIKNCKYASYTQVGSSKDATSLKNMLKSLDYIRQCNQIRVQHGLPELKVSDVLMAQAQANANAADVLMTHSLQFNVAENLAWGYDAPFEAWYEYEKKLYDAGERERSLVGHYLNIIDPDYKVTGYALCYTNIDNDGFDQTNSQTFHLYSIDGKTYSVDEYESRINAYIASLTTTPSENLENAKKRLAEALANQDKANETLNSAKEGSEQADTDYQNAKADYESIEGGLTDVKVALDHAAETLELTKKDKSDAETVLAEKEALYAQCENEFQAKVEIRDHTALSAETAKADLEQLEADVKTAKSNYEDAELALKEYGGSYSEEYKSALEKVKMLKMALDGKIEALDTIMEEFRNTEQVFLSADEEKKWAIENVQFLTQLIAEKEDMITHLSDEEADMKTAYETVKHQYKELEDSKLEISNKNDLLDTSKTEQENALNKLGKAVEFVKECEQALSKAEALKKEAESLDFDQAYQNGGVENGNFSSLDQMIKDLLKAEKDFTAAQDQVIALNSKKDTLKSEYEKTYLHYTSCLSILEQAQKDYDALKPQTKPEPKPRPKPESKPTKPVQNTINKVSKTEIMEGLKEEPEAEQEYSENEIEIPLDDQTVAKVTIVQPEKMNMGNSPKEKTSNLSTEDVTEADTKDEKPRVNPLGILLGLAAGGAAGAGFYHYKKRK